MSITTGSNKTLLILFVLTLLSCAGKIKSNKTQVNGSDTIPFTSNAIQAPSKIIDTSLSEYDLSVYWRFNGYLVFEISNDEIVKVDSVFFFITESNATEKRNDYLLSMSGDSIIRSAVYKFENGGQLVSIKDNLWRSHYFYVDEDETGLSVIEYNFTNDKGLLIDYPFLGEINDEYDCYDSMRCNILYLYKIVETENCCPEKVYESEFTSYEYPNLFDFQGLNNREFCYDYFKKVIIEYRNTNQN